MDTELQKLRIDKGMKARRHKPAQWPRVLLVLLILGGGGAAAWRFRGAGSGVAVHTLKVRMPEGAVTENDLVLLNATGYVIAAHKIQLASKVVGRVAWVGVER